MSRGAELRRPPDPRMPTGGREPKRKRPAAPLDGGGWEVSGSGGGVQEAASSGWGSSDMAPSSDMMVEDADVLDCDVCFLPLKPPIFQVLYTSTTTRFCGNYDRIDGFFLLEMEMNSA